jgi:hypothetical protein
MNKDDLNVTRSTTAVGQTPQPLVQCAACHQEPVEPVEAPCCGDVWCWRCAVERPLLETHCVCGQPLSLGEFRQAKAIKALLKRKQGPLRELAYDDVLPCPENCGVLLQAGRFEEHIRACLNVIEPCPNGCDDRQVKRKDMAEHVRDHCPLTSVPCKFGCSQVIPRWELADHMRDNMATHVDQVLSIVEAQNVKIEQLEQQLQEDAKGPKIRIEQVEHQRTRLACCGPFLVKRRCLVVVGLFLLAVMLVGIPLIAKLIVAGGAIVGMHWGFRRWVRGLHMSRPPFRSTETNILFGMLCVAICFSLWPLIFTFFIL